MSTESDKAAVVVAEAAQTSAEANTTGGDGTALATPAEPAPAAVPVEATPATACATPKTMTFREKQKAEAAAKLAAAQAEMAALEAVEANTTGGDGAALADLSVTPEGDKPAETVVSVVAVEPAPAAVGANTTVSDGTALADPSVTPEGDKPAEAAKEEPAAAAGGDGTEVATQELAPAEVPVEPAPVAADPAATPVSTDSTEPASPLRRGTGADHNSTMTPALRKQAAEARAAKLKALDDARNAELAEQAAEEALLRREEEKAAEAQAAREKAEAEAKAAETARLEAEAARVKAEEDAVKAKANAEAAAQKAAMHEQIMKSLGGMTLEAIQRMHDGLGDDPDMQGVLKGYMDGLVAKEAAEVAAKAAAVETVPVVVPTVVAPPVGEVHVSAPLPVVLAPAPVVVAPSAMPFDMNAFFAGMQQMMKQNNDALLAQVDAKLAAFHHEDHSVPGVPVVPVVGGGGVIDAVVNVDGTTA